MKVNPSPSAFLPGFDRRTASAVLVLLFILILAAALCFVFRMSAAGPDSIDRLMPTVPPATQAPQVQTAPPSGEVLALQEALAAAETERDTLRVQLRNAESEANRLADTLSDADAQNRQLSAELEELRLEQEKRYVLRFRAERKTILPGFSEVLSFAVTVDEETYDRWNNGDPVTGDTDFLTIPGSGPLHEWIVVMEEKSVTSPAENP